MQLLSCEKHTPSGYAAIPRDIDSPLPYNKGLSYGPYLDRTIQPDFRLGWHACLAHLSTMISERTS